MKIYYYNQSGFSLVETLVAISLLLIIIVGPMTISAKSAKSSTFATEQIQAFFLAQEGLELAQKARDDLLLTYFKDMGTTEPSPWGKFTDVSASGAYKDCFNPSGCGLEWNTTNNALVVPVLCTGTNCLLYKNNTANKRSGYTHTISGNTVTPFTRKIKFSTNSITREVLVISEVTWRTGSIIADQKVELDTYLFNTYALP